MIKFMVFSYFAGLFLSHRGTPINNDSFVSVGDNSNYNDVNALLCLTNATDCCGGPYRVGEWYFPNGTVVDSFGDNVVMSTMTSFRGTEVQV